VSWLTERVPQLRELLREHIDDNDETLPYVVFEGDFLRWFTHEVRAGERDAPSRFVAAMELLLTPPGTPSNYDDVWNLAAICFVDGLVMQGDDDVVEAARPWMGPNTAAQIDRSYAHRRGDAGPPFRR
jgi:hypothetical protein